MNKVKKTKKKYYLEKEVTSYDWEGVCAYWFFIFLQHVFLLLGIYIFSSSPDLGEWIGDWIGGTMMIIFWGILTWTLSSTYMESEDIVRRTNVKEEVKLIEE